MPKEYVTDQEETRGRPTKYKPEFVRLARTMCELGATDVELAEEFDCSIMTLWHWRARYEDFAEACQVGKEFADGRVVRSLYQRACGYTHDSEKIFCTTLRSEVGEEKISEVEVTRVPTREHVPPDTTAAIFWLKNRRPKEWRDRHELTGPDGGPLSSQVTVVTEKMTPIEAHEAYLAALKAIDAGTFFVEGTAKQLPAPEAETKKKRSPRKVRGRSET